MVVHFIFSQMEFNITHKVITNLHFFGDVINLFLRIFPNLMLLSDLLFTLLILGGFLNFFSVHLK